MSPDGSLILDELPKSHPGVTDSSDLPPECRYELLDLRANSPSRPVDWRWQAACRFAMKGFSLRFRDWHLFWVVRFRWALLEWGEELFGRNCRDNAAGALNMAYSFYHAGSGPTRWELEARILANEPSESIGQRFDLSPEAVDWYEAVFFNVRDRLRATGYITHQVIRLHDPWKGLPNDLERFWKFFGYWGGPRAIDELASGLAAPFPTADKVDFRKCINEHLGTMVHCKAFVALEMLPLDDPATAMQFLKIWVRIMELESREQRRNQAGPEVNITLNIQYFLDYMQKKCGGTYLPVAAPSSPAVAEPVSPSPVVLTSDAQASPPGQTGAADAL